MFAATAKGSTNLYSNFSVDGKSLLKYSVGFILLFSFYNYTVALQPISTVSLSNNSNASSGLIERKSPIDAKMYF